MKNSCVSNICAVILFLILANGGHLCGVCHAAEQMVCDDCISVTRKESLWNFGGWLEAGMMANQYGQRDAYTADGFDPESGNTAHLENVQHASFQMNQLWLYLEKTLDKDRFDIGGRVEFMYGTDGRFFHVYGLEHNESTDGCWGLNHDYYPAIPQMYVEMGYGDVHLKVGKFFTIMGLDSACAPERFFYSTSHENQTYIDVSGFLLTWDVTEKLSVNGGWVNGEEHFFTDTRHNAFLGGVTYVVGPRLTLDYSLLIGRDDGERDYFISSLVARLKITDRWDYAFAWVLRNEKGLDASPEHWGRYGIYQELIHEVNEKVKVGLGIEWLKNYDCGESYDNFAIRLGANWNPISWLTLRPEIRYDYCTDKPFNIAKSNGTDPKAGQFLYGCCGIVTF